MFLFLWQACYAKNMLLAVRSLYSLAWRLLQQQIDLKENQRII